MRLSDIVSLFKDYLILGVVAIIILSMIFFIGYKIIYQKILKGKKRISKKKLFLYGITIIYAIIVLGAVFLNRGGGMYGTANLHLFSSYKEAYHKMEISLFRNIILNILLFIPLGFLIPIYSKKLRKIYIVVPIGFFVTFIIEIIQYITKIGILEIDDIFNNTIGVLLGYCMYMILNNIKNKENRKYIIFYLIPFLAEIAVFCGIFITYNKQELGNLSFEYNYKINMKDVKINSKVDVSKDITNQKIYYKKELTEFETRKIAEEIFGKLETEISKKDTDIYEDTAIYYSTGRIYNLWVDFKDGTYSFNNYLLSGEKNIKHGANREEIENALQKFGIDIPKIAQFKENDNTYIFSVDMEEQDNYLINGNIICTYYEDETIKNIKNNLVKYENIKEKEIISQEEAYNQIKEGKFQYFEKINSIDIENIELKYDIDSKGYYVPIYSFKAIINGKDTNIFIKAIR